MRYYGMIAFIFLCLFGTAAQAHERHHSHHRFHGATSRQIYICAGCVVRETMAGAVAVSEENASRLAGAINALYDAGFRGPVNCAAPYGTHVAHSLHHTGNACDMAQTGWGKSSAQIMYHASAILARFGVNDGCSFGDCGHISVGAQEAFRGGHRHYAWRHYRHFAHRYRRRYARI